MSKITRVAAVMMAGAAIAGLAACSSTSDAATTSVGTKINPDAAFVVLMTSHKDTFGEIADEATAAGTAAEDMNVSGAVRHANRVSDLFGELLDDLEDTSEVRASSLGRTTVATWTQCQRAWGDSADALASLDAADIRAATDDIQTCTEGTDSLSASVTELTGA